MNIYTGRGDDGKTDLRDLSRVSKSSLRIKAYGTVDEANALVGTVRPTGYDDLDALLETVQNHLHVVQADLANPDLDPEDPQVDADHVVTLETEIDGYDEELAPLQSFILPGGGTVGARLHHARTVVRRAERRTVELAQSEPINETVVTYLNRLSDLLFTLGRVANARDGEPEESPTY